MSINSLLDFIAKPESGNNFNIVYGGIKAQDRPKKPLTQMTIGEVLDWQDSIDARYPSEAAGAYQLMEDTLRPLPASAGLTTRDLFNEANQRKLATVLLKRRGLDKYLSGTISATQFAQNLSMEWASLPCTITDKRGRAATGQSYYAGDGLNKSHVTTAAFMAAVYAVRTDAQVSHIPEPTASDRLKPVPFFAGLISAAIAILFSGKVNK